MAEPREVREITLFIVALLLSALQWSILILGQHLLLGGSPFDFGGSFVLRVLILEELGPFLVNPVLLFYVSYRLGKRVSLANRYRTVAVILFVGGTVGGGVTHTLLPLAFGGTWGAVFSNLLSVVAIVASFTYMFAEIGLGTLFPGFVAIALANLRHGELRRVTDGQSSSC